MAQVTFNDLTLNVNYKLLWTIYGEYSSDVAIGLITASLMLLDQVGESEMLEDSYVTITNEEGIQIVIEEFDEINNIFGKNLVVRADYKLYHRLNPGQFGILIDVYNRNNMFRYLIKVNNIASFLQGFITICSSFGVDFRKYIKNLPFDSNGTEYDLPEYQLEQYLYTRDSESESLDELEYIIDWDYESE